MKHSGKARKAAARLIVLTLVPVLVILGVGAAVASPSRAFGAVASVLIGLWVLFALFTLYFFRDPDAKVPAGNGLVLSPGHGTVDAIDLTAEPAFMGGECQRISIFLSVLNVHVQNAPVTGRVAFFKYTTGKFLSALKSECSVHNENVLVGIEAKEPNGQRMALRLIAGVLARRIVPWIQQGSEIVQGERISLIQFGSRVDVFLPRAAQIKIKIGDKVVGGETVLAIFA